MDLREELFSNQDLKYREFHKKLVPNVDENRIIGVRLPVMRKLAKQDFGENKCEYYEEIMIKGFTVANKKCSVEEHLEDLKNFVPMIDNWGVCDSVCSSLKFTEKYKEEMYPFILSYIDKSEFETRFAIVMLIDYYLTDEYIDEVLDIFRKTSGEYYVNMAVAWAISAAFVKYREKTLALLEEKTLPKDVQNKAIQKIKDSFRVTKEDKDYLSGLKIV